jgi:hypothetical protein
VSLPISIASVTTVRTSWKEALEMLPRFVFPNVELNGMSSSRKMHASVAVIDHQRRVTYRSILDFASFYVLARVVKENPTEGGRQGSVFLQYEVSPSSDSHSRDPCAGYVERCRFLYHCLVFWLVVFLVGSFLFVR